MSVQPVKDLTGPGWFVPGKKRKARMMGATQSTRTRAGAAAAAAAQVNNAPVAQKPSASYFNADVSVVVLSL